ncbi:thiosulfate sulfurtransferase/rhodanese-like domain-containing protein 3 isoform X3 [Cebus imitator]|uniref:thiosulfate sulfurtransferase/rhodanese-like domain-containing protein 3 isoform X3 n=1 Tax=Cebus imitator TaxID=2715852 RepID=UPI0018998C51|nr:thiosulfate sulfurtransferase/rhodanese-like domain-containing protein 3 isoform X3 [Cebus imitator]
MLIDVREAWEILEYGKIPGSINIPLDEVGEALQMNPRDFKEKYNEVKPSKSDNLVFSCLAGVRSKKALDTAISLGFHRSQYSYPLNPGVTSKSLKIQSFQGAASNTEVLKNSEDHAHSSLIPTVIDFSAPRTGRNKYML